MWETCCAGAVHWLCTDEAVFNEAVFNEAVFNEAVPNEAVVDML